MFGALPQLLLILQLISVPTYYLSSSTEFYFSEIISPSQSIARELYAKKTQTSIDCITTALSHITSDFRSIIGIFCSWYLDHVVSFLNRFEQHFP